MVSITWHLDNKSITGTSSSIQVGTLEENIYYLDVFQGRTPCALVTVKHAISEYQRHEDLRRAVATITLG